jgi:hypothetical protein
MVVVVVGDVKKKRWQPDMHAAEAALGVGR